MSSIGQRERATQNRVVELFQNELEYDYYGDWQDRADNSNIEEAYLAELLGKQGVNASLAALAIRDFKRAANMGDGKKLFHANKDVYSLLRISSAGMSAHGIASKMKPTAQPRLFK